MTTLQLSADIQRSLEQIEGDESLMQRAANYLRRLAKKREDPTLMTREEFFKQVDEALEQAERGEVVSFTDRNEMNKWLNSL